MTPEISIFAGWMGILSAFGTGMLLGLVTQWTQLLGAHGDASRKYVRLGHIAMAALGMINILAGICIKVGFAFSPITQTLLIVGMITMPLACFITAYHKHGFFLFPIPAMSLFMAVVYMLPILIGGLV